MFIRRKILRLRDSELFPVIILAVSILLIIRLCNKHDEWTGNHYMLEDKEKGSNGLCPLYPSTLQESRPVEMSLNLEWKDIEQHLEYVQTGGVHSPIDCNSRQQLALIIPYRNREHQLKLFLHHIHPFLQRQKRSYQIFVVEQMGNVTFNKGLIMNIASSQVLKSRSITFDCFIFHDVDLLPENDYNVYECDRYGPRHLAPAIDELRYILMYNDLVGGALGLTKEQFLKSNGWSNLYWGWGLEDDDMNHRLVDSGYRISRPLNHIGRYKMMRHEKQVPAVKRRQTLSKWYRYPHDGIRQLDRLNYSIVSIHKRPLYTHILVNITRSSTKAIEHLL